VAESDPTEMFLRGMDAMNRFDTAVRMDMVDDESVFEPLRSATEGAFIGRDGMRNLSLPPGPVRLTQSAQAQP
jgi:hypothetical protein